MEHPADAVLRHFFQAERIGSNERSLVAETLFGVLRHRLLLEHGCTLDDKGQATARRMALAYWVKFGGYNLRELEPLLKAKEAEWLGKVKEHQRQRTAACPSRPNCRNGSSTNCARNTAMPRSLRWDAPCSSPPRSICA